MTQHQPVLLREVLELLAIKSDGIYVDATFGRGGHAQAILERLNEKGKLVLIDRDPEAIQHARKLFANESRVIIEQRSFAYLEEIIKKHDLSGKVNGVLLDLGVSSPQLDEAQRGFSFLREGPLDMRMDPSTGVSAADWINSAKEPEISDVLKEYGEERFARRIARAIILERKNSPIETTSRLASIVSAANPAWERNKHPATRTFQAIRIFINNELNALRDALKQCLSVLAMEGRLAVISFHSLEDRIVKRFMRSHARSNEWGSPQPLQLVGKAIKAGVNEINENPRARSAVLRIAEKIV